MFSIFASAPARASPMSHRAGRAGYVYSRAAGRVEGAVAADAKINVHGFDQSLNLRLDQSRFRWRHGSCETPSRAGDLKAAALLLRLMVALSDVQSVDTSPNRSRLSDGGLRQCWPDAALKGMEEIDEPTSKAAY
jgi:hypothetical protein